MSTNEDKFVVEEGMPQSVIDKVNAMSEEIKTSDSNIEFVENTESIKEVPDVEVNLDAPEPEAVETPPETTEDTPNEEAPPENFDIDQDKFEAFAKEQGFESDAFAEKLFKDRKFKVKVGGKEKEFDYHQIKSTLSREESSQQRYDKLRSSEEYKLGLLAKAAQDGDVKAQKKLRDFVVKSSGAEDADDMNDKLEDVEGEYEEKDTLEEERKAEEFEEFFGEVKEDVDYETHLDTINNELKSFMPQSIFDRYWNEAKDRRAMYDLAASGRLEELTSAFQEELDTLPLEKRMELEGDSELYGRAFVSVIKKQNAKLYAQGTENPPEEDGLNVVSNGTRTTKGPEVSAKPNFATMTTQERQVWKRENGIQTIY